MLAHIYTGPKALEWREVAEPRLGSEETALVRARAARPEAAYTLAEGSRTTPVVEG